jgi:inorganic pyrophosphatase/exopolyphosphatase
MNLEELSKTKQLSIILVDHNKLAPHQNYLSDYVIGIVDHHEDESKAKFNYIRLLFFFC